MEKVQLQQQLCDLRLVLLNKHSNSLLENGRQPHLPRSPEPGWGSVVWVSGGPASPGDGGPGLSGSPVEAEESSLEAGQPLAFIPLQSPTVRRKKH